MKATLDNTTATAVRRAAIDLLRVHDARVTRYRSNQSCRDIDPDTDSVRDLNRGEWYTLSIAPTAGDGPQLLGRRRTLGELLAMIERQAGQIQHRAMSPCKG